MIGCIFGRYIFNWVLLVTVERRENWDLLMFRRKHSKEFWFGAWKLWWNYLSVTLIYSITFLQIKKLISICNLSYTYIWWTSLFIKKFWRSHSSPRETRVRWVDWCGVSKDSVASDPLFQQHRLKNFRTCYNNIKKRPMDHVKKVCCIFIYILEKHIANISN